MMFDDFTKWVWGIMIVPIIALWQSKADKSEVAEAHNEVDQMRKELEHITDRVDKIYDHLIAKKVK